MLATFLEAATEVLCVDVRGTGVCPGAMKGLESCDLLFMQKRKGHGTCG